MSIAVKFALIILMIGAIASGTLEDARITVASEAVPPALGADARLYIGYLLNRQPNKIRLEGIQRPGGFGGSGVFLNCALEQWSPEARTWRTVWRPIDPLLTKRNIVAVSVDPGRQEEVCRQILPIPDAKEGCMRFRLSSSWTKSESEWISVPFVVGPKSAADTCVASATRNDR